jgi:hypothetical protein
LSFLALTSGAVIQFQFLWGHEALRGETEGRKPRPVVVGFRLNDSLLLMFPITTKQPQSDRFFREIPETEKRRAGLSPELRSWIILDEVNTDSLNHSVYLEPNCEMGRFSRAFTLHVFQTWVNERKSRKIKITSRKE